MNKYEGVFIFRPNMEEEKRNNIFDKVKGIIESNGSVENVDEWGTRKLAYEIKDRTEGYYILVNFEAETDIVNEVHRISGITDEILRHMIVKEEE
ncbi:MAG: 30S ribosomal protein S6 [Firmicutes bacterium]|nr:30S ribosomal protein S6 [Bacillota bacterium]